MISGLLLSFGEADFFLAVAFVEFEVEARVIVVDVSFTVSRAAAVANQDVAHHRVKNHVDCSEDEQNAQSPDWLNVPPGDRAESAAGYDHQQTQRLRKIFLAPEVFVSAAQTVLGTIVFNVCRADLSRPVMICAGKLRCLRRNDFDVWRVAFRALINQLHVESSFRSGSSSKR